MQESTSERGPCGVAIVFALREEVRPLLKESRIEAQVSQGSSHLFRADFRGIPVIFCQTGVGMANAHEGTEHLLRHFKPRLIISAGCAGGTQADLRPGDAILPTEIWSETPSDRFLPAHGILQTLEVLLQEEDLRFQKGPLMTVWKVADKRLKEEAAARGALAVDMETAAVAAIAEKTRIPFVSLRMIFDPLEEELPFTEPFDEEHPVRFLMKNPKALLKIPKYARWNHLCRAHLYRVLARFIDCYGR